jgi:C1A family cysteine protease
VELSIRSPEPGGVVDEGDGIDEREGVSTGLGGFEITGPDITGSLTAGLGRGGWHPDLPDHRDVEYQPHAHEVDESLDLRDTVGAAIPQVMPYDQGRLPSCASNAVAAALVYLQAARGREVIPPSRMYLYWNERFGPGRPSSEGVSLRVALKSLNSYGVCPEELWPYRAGTLDRNPSYAAYEAARYTRGVQYQRIVVPPDQPAEAAKALRQCVANGWPVLFGVTVYDNFLESRVGKNGMIDEPSAGSRAYFGHAGLIVGYQRDGDGTVFTCQNSWGTDWGDHGFYRLPDSYLANRKLTRDFWAITELTS